MLGMRAVVQRRPRPKEVGQNGTFWNIGKRCHLAYGADRDATIRNSLQQFEKMLTAPTTPLIGTSR